MRLRFGFAAVTPFLSAMLLGGWSALGVMRAAEPGVGVGEPGREASVSVKDAALHDALVEYFRAAESSKRADLAEDVRRLSKGSPSAVAEALEDLALWEVPAAREGEFEAAAGRSSRLRVTYRLPQGYTPNRRFPLLVTIEKARQVLNFGVDWAVRPDFRAWLPASAAEEFVHIRYFTATDATFAASGVLVEEFRAVLREVRRRFRTDSDLVFLHGEWDGGEAAWQVAMFQPHVLAGAILVASCPDLPYPQETYRIIVARNLARLPILLAVPETSALGPRAPVLDATPSARGREASQGSARAESPELQVEPDTPDAAGSPPGEPAPPDEHLLGRMDAAGRALELLAEEAGAPWNIFRYSLERSLRESVVAGESAEVLSLFLARSRGQDPQHVNHVFRFPSQGDAGWARQARFLGDAWKAEAISIVQQAPRDAGATESYIERTLSDKLASIAGIIHGQVIELETRRCAGLDVLLRSGQVDWTRPVTVRINGARRHEGVVEPDIAVMLEEAYRDWEFQHPPWARLSFSIRGESESKDPRP